MSDETPSDLFCDTCGLLPIDAGVNTNDVPQGSECPACNGEGLFWPDGKPPPLLNARRASWAQKLPRDEARAEVERLRDEVRSKDAYIVQLKDEVEAPKVDRNVLLAEVKRLRALAERAAACAENAEAEAERLRSLMVPWPDGVDTIIDPASAVEDGGPGVIRWCREVLRLADGGES